MLRDAGLPARPEASGVDERAVEASNVHDLVQKLALQKARAVARRFPDAWVIGADQLLHQDGDVWGKPQCPEQHLDRLLAMRGRRHELVTGFAILGPDVHYVDLEISTMWVRADLEQAELAAYVASGEGTGCAGGYTVEGQGAFLFEKIEGDWNNVIGLPLFRVFEVLRRHGWRFGGTT